MTPPTLEHRDLVKIRHAIEKTIRCKVHVLAPQVTSLEGVEELEMSYAEVRFDEDVGEKPTFDGVNVLFKLLKLAEPPVQSGALAPWGIGQGKFPSVLIRLDLLVEMFGEDHD